MHKCFDQLTHYSSYHGSCREHSALAAGEILNAAMEQKPPGVSVLCVATYLRRQWRGGTLVLWRSRLWHFSGLIHNTSWPSSPSHAPSPSARWLWTVRRSQVSPAPGLWNPWQYVPHCCHSWSRRAADGRLTASVLIQPGHSVPWVTTFPSLLQHNATPPTQPPYNEETPACNGDSRSAAVTSRLRWGAL